MAYSLYGQERVDYSNTTGKDYKYPTVEQTEPKSINYLAGPYKIDYMYGTYQGVSVAGIVEMIMKDKDGKVVTYSTKDLGNTPRWYIANADGTPLTSGYGTGGNYPKPNQEFYIKVVKFHKSKAYVTFKVEKIETHSTYVSATGWYTITKGSNHQCNNCKLHDRVGCGKTISVRWSEVVNNFRRVRPNGRRNCPYCGKSFPAAVIKANIPWYHQCGTKTIWHTETHFCGWRDPNGDVRFCCTKHYCGGISEETYPGGTDNKGNSYPGGHYQCAAAATRIKVRSQYIHVVEEPYRILTEINLELEIKLDSIDLSLRKFVTGVNDEKITNRVPQVDTTPLRNETDTTAIYNHTKEPVRVKVGDLVEYTIRVYNEGTANGYAEEVTDYLPTNLEFVSATVDGVDYGWKVTTENGRQVIKTNYLADKILKAFSSEGTFNSELDYKDLKLICKVKDTATANEKITNITEITKYKDKEGNIIDGDIDSVPNNIKLPADEAGWQNYNGAGQSGNYVKGQEDDDDFEKLIIWYTYIEGNVWKDGVEGKQEERDGVLTNRDERFENIDVVLYQDRKSDGNYVEIGRTKTDANGHYIFTKLADGVSKNPANSYSNEANLLEVNKKYIVKFGYGGQEYEPVAVTAITSQSYTAENSAAYEVTEERNALNAKFYEIVNGTSKLSNETTGVNLEYDKDTNKHTSTLIRDRARTEGEAFWQASMIWATTGEFPGTIKNEAIHHINLGLLERAQINFGIMSDVEKAELTINGKTSTYEHNRRDENTAIDIELKTSSLDVVYNQAIYKSDYTYRIEDYQDGTIAADQIKNGDELEVYITYKIKIKNYSSNAGNITELVNYYTTEYKRVDSWYTKGEQTGKVEWQEATGVDGYKTEYTRSLKDVQIGANEDAYVYVKYQVEKGEGRALKIENTKYTYNEITGYSSVKGLIDTNSEPGNMDMTTIEKYVETYEDDTDRAPGLRIVLSEEERDLTGYVFEDMVAGKDSDGVNIGNGIFDGNDKKVSGVRVQLIELVEMKDGKTYEYIWEEAFTGDGKINYMTRDGKIAEEVKNVTVGEGEYKFREFIPGNYMIRFIYGDTVKTLNYTGQDFKATQYIGYGTNTSAAKDNKVRRKQVMDYSSTITNEKGEILAATNEQNPYHTQLLENTWMNADTQEVMDISVNTNNPGHHVNFGVIRRPKTQLTMIKEVVGLKVVHNGIVYVDTANEVETGLKKLPNGNYSLELDDELLNGAELYADYSVKIVNTGEKDTLYNYFEGDPTYGTNQHEIVTTSADRICDYPENIGYDEGTNPDWTTQNIDYTILGQEVQDKINQNKVLVITTTKLTKDLKPGEETETVKFTTSKLMAVGAEDDMIYSNVAEIVQVTNKVGRRDEGSIPGNYVPLSNIINEVDTDDATVTVTDPTGLKGPQIYYVLSIVVGVMLVIGIVLIKKVVKKK